MVEGWKISGNVQFLMKGRMFSYGIFFFDLEIENVVLVLKVKKDKIEFKGIKFI